MGVKLAIIGYGYWGKNLVRNFNNLENCTVKYVCEREEKSAKKCSNLYPGIKVVSEYEEVLSDPEIDAVVIATSINTHYDLSKKALENDKHVLVEKPMTDSFEKAKELKRMADKLSKVLMVDHTFLYTGAVSYLKKKIDEGEYGQINYIDSTRVNLGLFQQDLNVLWDLAPHDISICFYLMNALPLTVQATGISHTENNIENIAYLTLKYDNDTIVHFNCSWVSPVKIRQMLIGGSKKMVVFNDMEPTEKIKIYDTGFRVRSDQEKDEFTADYRVGDIFVPKVGTTEALSAMAQDFIAAIVEGKEPDSNADIGMQVVRILDAAEKSLKNNGQEIAL
ncbi:Gfo/Idh/MocA family oxidoreductase [Reichenbachiella sp.]|uniref:Gfo/Idh/MocA family protein n=1 Tax=Reichenbachiella sp. TaxID=2184521 RepID=UPI00329955D0